MCANTFDGAEQNQKLQQQEQQMGLTACNEVTRRLQYGAGRGRRMNWIDPLRNNL